MKRASLLLLFAIAAATAAAQGQPDSCEDDLPALLIGNYSGLMCQPVWNDFVLRYSRPEDNVLSVVLSTLYSEGWVGMGFSKDGMMVGSSAMVGWMGKTGVPHIKQFRLRGKNSSEVVVNEGDLLSTEVTHRVLVQEAKIFLAFQLRFPAPVEKQHVLFAFGARIPVDNRLKIHQDKTSMLFDFSQGTTVMTYPHNLKRTHGALGIFAWGVLLPIGTIVARYCKNSDPLWFYLHVGIQFIGFIIGLAGVVAGVALYNKLHPHIPAHRGLGIFILVLGILQILSFFIRPDKEGKIRKYWDWYHHWVGRLVLFFAAVNIILGIEAGRAGVAWQVGYGITLAVLLVAIIILEVLLRTRCSAKTAPPMF